MVQDTIDKDRKKKSALNSTNNPVDLTAPPTAQEQTEAFRNTEDRWCASLSGFFCRLLFQAAGLDFLTILANVPGLVGLGMLMA